MKTMKKILAVALLCAVSTFATWDYFPVLDAGKGELKVGPEILMRGDWTGLGANAKVRYTVIDGLELALFLNAPLAMDYEDAGLNSPVIGVRYWLKDMGIGAFADVMLPFDTFDEGNEDLHLRAGAQFSTELSSELSLGSEARFLIPINDYEDLDLGLGVEIDYSMGSITPFVGLEIENIIADPDMAVDLVLGGVFELSSSMSVDASVALGIVNEADDMPITIGANIAIKF